MDLIWKILKSKKLYYTTGSLILFGVAVLLILNFWVMPAYTNYNEGITVPDVTKISLQEAEELLESYGLRHEVLDRRANSAYPADYIIDQAPAPLQLVKPNRKIYLTVNTAVRPTSVVPNLENMSLRNAQIQIENYGFVVGTISYESSRFRNTVMRQSLAPGDTVARGEVINLTVSDGLGDRKVRVPDIVGDRLTDAQQKIRRAGLRVGEIRFEPSREATPNTILSFSPDEEELTEGETLTLVVSERFDVREETEAGAVGADTTVTTPLETVDPDTLDNDDNDDNQNN